MTGQHDVRVFPYFPDTSIPLRLPEGWKPFSSYLNLNEEGRLMLYVVARKWNRAEPEA